MEYPIEATWPILNGDLESVFAVAERNDYECDANGNVVVFARDTEDPQSSFSLIVHRSIHLPVMLYWLAGLTCMCE